MADLRFATFGAGWWAQIQLAGWKELQGAQCVAIYNRTRSKAEATAKDNLKTIRLIYAAYDSAAGGKAIDLNAP